MNEFRNLLICLALVLALGVSFGTGTYHDLTERGLNPETELCERGILKENGVGQCSSSITLIRCKLELSSAEIVNAWDDGGGITLCTNPLYRQY